MSVTPTLASVIRDAMDARLAQVHVALPGRIEEYDAAEQKASIKPLVKFTQSLEDGDVIDDLPIINDVPIVFPRGGGHFMSFPMAKGDFVLIIVCESSIEKFATGDGTNQDPIDTRRHALADAVAIPGLYPFASALDGGTDADGSQFGKEGGAIVHVSDDEVNLYEKAAADFVALAQLVKDEITALRDTVNSFVTAYNSHIHTTTATIGPSAVPGVIAPTTSTATAPAVVGDVKAEKVKAT